MSISNAVMWLLAGSIGVLYKAKSSNGRLIRVHSWV